MKKGTKIFALVILSLFLTSMLIGVVSAVDLVSPFVDKVSSLFDSNNTSSTFFKALLSPEILFGLLIFLVVFAIINQIPLFTEDWIKVTISIVIAFLAGGFIDASFLLPLLNQYTALGITITFLLPLILIFYFLKTVATTNPLLQRAIWIPYAIIVVVNAIANWKQLPAGWNLAKGLYILIILMAFIMIIWGGRIFNQLFIQNLKTDMEKWSKLEKGQRAVKAAQLEEVARYYDEIGDTIQANDARAAAKRLSNIR